MDKYWRATGAQNLSSEFKELFLRMVNMDPAQRPTIEELSNSGWLLKPIDSEKIRRHILGQQTWSKQPNSLSLKTNSIEQYIEGSSTDISLS